MHTTAASDVFIFLAWHYGEGLRSVAKRAVLRVLGILNFFSVRQHLLSLVSPWRRIADSYGSGFDPAAFLQILIGNAFSRAIGFVARSVMIAAGAATGAVAALFGLAALAFWVFLPLIIAGGMVFGGFAITRGLLP